MHTAACPFSTEKLADKLVQPEGKLSEGDHRAEEIIQRDKREEIALEPLIAVVYDT